MTSDRDLSHDAPTLRLIVIALMRLRSANLQVDYEDMIAMQDAYTLSLVEVRPAASLVSHFDVSIKKIPKEVPCDACGGCGVVRQD